MRVIFTGVAMANRPVFTGHRMMYPPLYSQRNLIEHVPNLLMFGIASLATIAALSSSSMDAKKNETAEVLQG